MLKHSIQCLASSKLPSHLQRDKSTNHFMVDLSRWSLLLMLQFACMTNAKF